MNKTHPNRPGFTLVEILIYVSIITATLLVFTNFVFDVTRNIAASKEKQELHQNARLVIERISQDIRSASQITAINAHGLSLIDGAGQSISYQQNATTIIWSNGVTNASLTSGTVEVTNLSFVDTSPTISIQLTVKPRTRPHSAGISESLSTSLTPRSSLY